MIRNLHIQNFKCLRDVSVDFEPLTVLIGPNDSGKSSLLEAMHLFSRMNREQLREVFPVSPADLIWRRRADSHMEWKLKSSGYSAKLRVGADGHASEEALDGPNGPVFTCTPGRVNLESLSYGNQRFNSEVPRDRTVTKTAADAKVANALRFVELCTTTDRYRLVPSALRQPSPLTPTPTLAADGSNLAAVLDALITGPVRSTINEIEAALARHIPTLRGLSLRQSAGFSDRKELWFTLAGNEKPPITIPAASASDGALLLTAFLTLAYGDTPEVILIEEPENGLHPGRLKFVVDILRKITTGEIGNRPRQIVMTTHSPLLLNYVKPEEVRIFRQLPQTGTEVTPLTKVPDIDRLLKEFAVGELWFLLEEEALVKGASPHESAVSG